MLRKKLESESGTGFLKKPLDSRFGLPSLTTIIDYHIICKIFNFLFFKKGIKGRIQRQVSSYFHSYFSPISRGFNPAGQFSNPAGKSLTLN